MKVHLEGTSLQVSQDGDNDGVAAVELKLNLLECLDESHVPLLETLVAKLKGLLPSA